VKKLKPIPSTIDQLDSLAHDCEDIGLTRAARLLRDWSHELKRMLDDVFAADTKREIRRQSRDRYLNKLRERHQQFLVEVHAQFSYEDAVSFTGCSQLELTQRVRFCLRRAHRSDMGPGLAKPIERMERVLSCYERAIDEEMYSVGEVKILIDRGLQLHQVIRIRMYRLQPRLLQRTKSHAHIQEKLKRMRFRSRIPDGIPADATAVDLEFTDEQRSGGFTDSSLSQEAEREADEEHTATRPMVMKTGTTLSSFESRPI